MIYSGRIYSDGYQYYNVEGNSWSATTITYEASYALYIFYGGRMHPQFYGNKLLGIPVRCLA